MNKKGFTLVEMIVSFTLVSVICIFLFQIVAIINNIFIEQGVKTQMVLNQSSISNAINKDLFNNANEGNVVVNIEKISEEQLDITFKDGITRSIIVNKKDRSISYNKVVQKFMSGTEIGNIRYNFDYDDSINLSNNGILTIIIPVNYNKSGIDYSIRISYRFNSSDLVIQ